MGANPPFDGSSMHDDLKIFDSSAPGPSISRIVKAISYYSPILHDKRILLEFPGEKAFHLYETYGLPLDFMMDAARDAGIGFDMEGFERARAEEQSRARASWKGGSQKTASPAFRELPKTVFEGYQHMSLRTARVLAIVKDGVGVPAAAVGDAVEVVLDHTSFLRGFRRAGGRHRVLPRSGSELDGCGDHGLRCAGAGSARAQGGAAAAAGCGRHGAHAGGRFPARCDQAQPHGDALAACRRCGRCWARM